MNKKILIIEYDEKIANLVKLYLEKERFKIFVAYDGQEGLTVFERENCSGPQKLDTPLRGR